MAVKKLLVKMLLPAVLAIGALRLHAQEYIVPQPNHTASSYHHYWLKPHDVIAVDATNRPIGEYLKNYMDRYYHLPLEVKQFTTPPANAAILLTTQKMTNAEGYTLKVNEQGIRIAGTGAGIFYGVQSLVQCLPDPGPEELELNGVNVVDAPRFGWRGLSLDVCRHFFTVQEVKQYIDIMSHYKLNVLHWHLTDDEGWRIQVEKYPRLTEVGARIGYYAAQGKFRKLDNLVDGGRDGFYTKDDIREVLQYAAAHYVTVLPEIEMPSHSEAAIFAYPELGCQDSTGAQHRVTLLDPSEHAFAFLEEVLSVVMELFPDPYIHIGGDEANMKAWLKSPVAVALMKREHMQDVKEVQSYFIKRIEKYLLAHNRKLVGWDEILQGGLAQSATVMSWEGEAGGIAAARMHHPVVMTPLPQMYFDAPQANEALEPVGWNPPVPWQMVYAYDPVPSVLTAVEASYILGVQGNIWTEKIPNNEHLQYMIYPRALALAEVAWTARGNKNTSYLKYKLRRQYHLLKLWGVNARLPDIDSVANVTTNLPAYKVTLTHALDSAAVHYTLDGSLPDTATAGEQFPITINVPLKDSLTLTTSTSWTMNHQRILQRGIIKRVVVDPVFTKPPLQKGLAFQRYTTDEEDYTRLSAQQADSNGFAASTAPFIRRADDDPRWVELTGYLKIDKEGDYTLLSEIENSPAVFLNKLDAPIITEGLDRYATPQRAELHLVQGIYAVRLFYKPVSDREKGKVLKVFGRSASGEKVELSGGWFH